MIHKNSRIIDDERKYRKETVLKVLSKIHLATWKLNKNHYLVVHKIVNKNYSSPTARGKSTCIMVLEEENNRW